MASPRCEPAFRSDQDLDCSSSLYPFQVWSREDTARQCALAGWIGRRVEIPPFGSDCAGRVRRGRRGPSIESRSGIHRPSNDIGVESGRRGKPGVIATLTQHSHGKPRLPGSVERHASSFEVPRGAEANGDLRVQLDTDRTRLTRRSPPEGSRALHDSSDIE